MTLDFTKIDAMFAHKTEFWKRYTKLTDLAKFKEVSFRHPRKCIRVNTAKITVKELLARLKDSWKLTQVPWCKEGFWIEGERRDIGNLQEHVLGYLYVQESASMIPPIVLESQPGELVLDMCAAPGSKTTQIGAMMKNAGLLVANDVEHSRLAALGINVQRMGLMNTVITRMDAKRFTASGLTFDRILVDAPCSGTGTISKSFKTIEDWSPRLVERIAAEQRMLLKTAWGLLAPGGTMVYSTCTLEPQEDEGNVSWLLDMVPDARIEDITLDIKRSPPVSEFGKETYRKEVKKCLRIWPQDNDSEGFFVAKFRKEG